MQTFNNNLTNFKEKWFDFMDYKPHGGQAKLHFPTKEEARFFVMICGRRFGKSTAAAMEATYYASQPNYLMIRLILCLGKYGSVWLLEKLTILRKPQKKNAISGLNGAV